MEQVRFCRAEEGQGESKEGCFRAGKVMMGQIEPRVGLVALMHAKFFPPSQPDTGQLRLVPAI